MAVASRVTDSSLRQVLVLLGPAMKMPPAVSLGQRHTAAKRIAENPVATPLGVFEFSRKAMSGDALAAGTDQRQELCGR